MQEQNSTEGLSAAFFVLAGVSAAGLLIPRELGTTLFFSFFTAFFGYFWLCRGALSPNLLLSVGIIARLILFMGMPALSDDIYRFLWDGYLLHAGVNPYTQLPETLLHQGIPNITPELFDQLNSKPYYSVYPPFNQFFFWLSTWFGESLLLQTNILRAILLLADIGSWYFMKRILSQLNKDPNLAFWYFLNPLAILEITGNIHFEGLVIFFMMAGIYFFTKNQSIKSGWMIGLGIATKLLPLIYIPAIFFKNPKNKGLITATISGVVALVTFIPFFTSGALRGIQSSLGLYFQKFEFNASIYFILREIGFWIKGYNIIGSLGPWLSSISLLGILAISFIGSRRNWILAQTMLFALTWYLLMTTTVHPWYILPLLAFGVLSGFYYPVIWSLFIFLTYLGYTSQGFELSSHWIILEYAVVFIALAYEISQKYRAKEI